MNRIREEIKRRGITQLELAKAIKISHERMSYIVNGNRKPTYQNIIDIANYFNVSIDYLFGRTDDRAFNPVTKHQNISVNGGNNVITDKIENVDTIFKIENNN